MSAAPLPDLSAVTRFEVIDGTRLSYVILNDGVAGRVLISCGVSVAVELQDDGRTLKVFLSDPED